MVPYVQIFCLFFLRWGFKGTNESVLEGLGEGRTYFLTELKKTGFGIILVFATLPFGAFWVAVFQCVYGVACCYLGSYKNKKLIGYGFIDQILDVAPMLGLGFLVFGATYAVNFLPLPTIVMLAIQLALMIIIFYVLGNLLNIKGMRYWHNNIKKYLPMILKSLGKKKNETQEQGKLE